MDTSTSWVEGDGPNESTMKLATSALKFLHRPGFDDQPLAHLGFDLRPSWFSGPNTIFFLDQVQCDKSKVRSVSEEMVGTAA